MLRRARKRQRRKTRTVEIHAAKKVELSLREAAHREFCSKHDVEPCSNLARVPILIPERLSLRDNYQETVETISAIRKAVLVDGSPVMLYFDKLKELEPSALLMLTAEIYRCKNLRRSRIGMIVNGNYPKENETYFQLREMGFYRLIEVPERETITDSRDVGGRPFFVPFRTFKGVDPEFASVFCSMVFHGAFRMGEVALGRMVGALKEAMGNSEEHAYIKPGDLPTMKGRWWVIGYIDPSAHEMMITFFDQGIGIPKTLDVQLFDVIAGLKQLSWGPTDGNMIAAATELHRTSTGQAGRGKGFRDMKKFVDTCQDGELSVRSNRGAYRYTKGNEKISDESHSIGGTIIEWRVRNPEQVEVQDG
jgi:hypothetical protein